MTRFLEENDKNDVGDADDDPDNPASQCPERSWIAQLQHRNATAITIFHYPDHHSYHSTLSSAICQQRYLFSKFQASIITALCTNPSFFNHLNYFLIHVPSNSFELLFLRTFLSSPFSLLV